MSAVDVRTVLTEAVKVHDDAKRGGVADSLGGVTKESTQAAFMRIAGRLKYADQARDNLAELIDSLLPLFALYRIKWGNLDADANAVYERAASALAKVTGESP